MSSRAQFVGALFSAICVALETNLLATTTYQTHTNSYSERFNK